jgi:hypothetical protein
VGEARTWGCERGKGEIRPLHKYANRSRANELSKNIGVANSRSGTTKLDEEG